MSFGLDLRIVWLTFLAIVDKRAALDGVVKILESRAADTMLTDICRRDKPLGAYPPPGSDEIETGDRKTRSEEHTSELQSLMRSSYAVFCLKKKKSHLKA